MVICLMSVVVIKFIVVVSGVGVWMVVIFRNLIFRLVKKIWIIVGMFVVLFGLINCNFVGSRSGLSINNSYNGNKKRDVRIFKNCI